MKIEIVLIMTITQSHTRTHSHTHIQCEAYSNSLPYKRLRQQTCVQQCCTAPAGHSVATTQPSAVRAVLNLCK